MLALHPLHTDKTVDAHTHASTNTAVLQTTARQLLWHLRGLAGQAVCRELFRRRDGVTVPVPQAEHLWDGSTAACVQWGRVNVMRVSREGTDEEAPG